MYLSLLYKLGDFSPRFLGGNLRYAHQIYIPFGEKILVLKFELPRISIMPSKITLNFYLSGLLYKGGPCCKILGHFGQVFRR